MPLLNFSERFSVIIAKSLLRSVYYICITMAMEAIQVRMSKGLIKKVDQMVKTGLYANRSDAVRDAVRKISWKSLIGSIPNTGDSVKEIREIRKKLSKKIKSFKDVEEINNLYD
jgi:Arc/MetJ-type ribon-helix-helix transcriptional regulator